MKSLLNLRYTLMSAMAFLLLGGGQTGALELLQKEGPDLPFACVTVANNDTASGTPVLSAACGHAFPAFWKFQNAAVLGPGTGNGIQTCLSVQLSTKEVVLRACRLSNLSRNEQWYFYNGALGSLAFSKTSYCLDSRGNYSNDFTLPTPAKLTVTPCTGSTTQNWILK
jgi:Ricin-type beta-trefoil lectin domain